MSILMVMLKQVHGVIFQKTVPSMYRTVSLYT